MSGHTCEVVRAGEARPTWDDRLGYGLLSLVVVPFVGLAVALIALAVVVATPLVAVSLLFGWLRIERNDEGSAES